MKGSAVLLFGSTVFASIFVLLFSNPVAACSRVKQFSFDELFVADAIVRATAERYTVEPDPLTRTTGIPDAKVAFHIEEVLRGNDIGDTIELNGYLGSNDDFNEQKVPYKFVRSNGRSGSCFANTYKTDGQYLLFLKKTDTGFTPNISALGPNNEQLRGDSDPWVKWVRAELAKRTVGN